eukprot:gene12902-14137_t
MKEETFTTHSESQPSSFSSMLDDLDPYMERLVCLSKGMMVFSLTMAISIGLTPNRYFVSSSNAVMKIFNIPEKHSNRTVKLMVAGVGGAVGLLAAIPFTVQQFKNLELETEAIPPIEYFLSEESFNVRAEKIRSWQKVNKDASEDSFNSRMIRINAWRQQQQSRQQGDIFLKQNPSFKPNLQVPK